MEVVKTGSFRTPCLLCYTDASHMCCRQWDSRQRSSWGHTDPPSQHDHDWQQHHTLHWRKAIRCCIIAGRSLLHHHRKRLGANSVLNPGVL